MTSRSDRCRAVRAWFLRSGALLGGCAVLGTVSGCAGGATVGAGTQRRTAPSSVGTTAAASAARVWTRLDTAGIAFLGPKSWRSFPDPLGILPGPVWVTDVLTTQAGNPCWNSTHRDGSASMGCNWHVDPGGVEVMWSLQAQPTGMPATATVMAGRRAVRTAGPAEGDCRAAGGTRQVHMVLSGTADRRDVVAFVVDACLADPGADRAEQQLDMMLESLVAWRG
jgi:hypothetical protein